jgi:hypothetical protein
VRRLLLIGVSLLAVLALAGCEASVSTGGIDSDEVAGEAQVQLSKVSEGRGGGPFPAVDCPDELDEEAGSKMTCFADYDGEKHEITAEVTKVEDEKADVDFTADALPSK